MYEYTIFSFTFTILRRFYSSFLSCILNYNHGKKIAHLSLIIFICLVFIQSLYFKFTNSPETQYIFTEKLNSWAESFGYNNVFSPGGIFSAVHVGIIELAVTLLLIASIVYKKKIFEIVGAAVGLIIISGAIFFHLATPLGVSVKNTDGTYDGGQLFGLACMIFLSCLTLLYMNRLIIIDLLKRK